MTFLSVIFGVLTDPATTYRQISDTEGTKGRYFVWGLLLVLVISGFSAVYSPWIHTADWLPLRIILSAISGTVLWFFSGVIFATAAYAFGLSGRPQTLLTLTAYALLPWIFVPILMLLESSLGSFGALLASFGSLCVWLWSAILFLMALRFTYHMSIDRLLLAVCLPFLMTFVGMAWLGGFFFHLFQLLS